MTTLTKGLNGSDQIEPTQAEVATVNRLISVTPPAQPAHIERLAFSLKEAARMLGISYPTAYRLNKRGPLRSSGALRHKIIPRAEIERFLKSTLE